jgi:ParB family chromosome partitioning protein
MMDQISLLEISGVDPPEDAAREIIDPDKVRELAESIRSQGLLQPILVRPHSGRLEVVAGHRRYLAQILIGEVKIKGIVKELSDEETFLIRAMENDQREDLNPIEKAKIYRKLKDKFGWSYETVAQKMGRGRETIKRHLKLLEIPEEYQKEVARGRLGMAVALCLNEIDDLSFKNYYFTAAIENGVTLDVAEHWVTEYKKTRVGFNPGERGGMGVGGEVQEPLPIFQTCVCCIGPVEVNKVRYIPVCPNCEKEIRGALKPK